MNLTIEQIKDSLIEAINECLYENMDHTNYIYTVEYDPDRRYYNFGHDAVPKYIAYRYFTYVDENPANSNNKYSSFSHTKKLNKVIDFVIVHLEDMIINNYHRINFIFSSEVMYFTENKAIQENIDKEAFVNFRIIVKAKSLF
jgi:hypothetical protein